MKKLPVFIIIVVCITLSALLLFGSGEASQPFEPGEYILFGTYLNEPILWRVIGADSSGDPLLFSECIISIKAFCAKGDKQTDSFRKRYGSSYWPDSNLRQWLNSSKMQINWISNEPSAGNLCAGENPYSDESGFLSNDNFTAADRRAIKQISHDVPLCEADRDKRTGGDEAYRYNKNIHIFPNTGTAYYQTVSDKVFLLGKKELKEFVHDRGWDFRAKPTENARGQGEYKIYRMWTEGYGDYWIIDPVDNYSSNMTAVLGDNDIVHAMAYSVEGVRPALYLRLSKTRRDSGSGSLEDPYVLKARGLF